MDERGQEVRGLQGNGSRGRNIKTRRAKRAWLIFPVNCPNLKESAVSLGRVATCQHLESPFQFATP